ncbi:MAG: nucleotidyltransferase family protein, partial [Bacteroidales bacterium]|nr:nucleotidyltransferase family protein [Bacteroidales bacterium]
MDILKANNDNVNLSDSSSPNQINYDEILFFLIRNLNYPGDWANKLREVDEAEFVTHCIKRKVASIFYRHFNDYIPSSIITKLQRHTQEVENEINQMYTCYIRLFDEFQKTSINAILVKGIASSNFIYSDSYSRDFNDFDIIFHPTEIQRAFQIMKKSGFKQIFNSHTETMDFDLPVLEFRYDFHEYPMYNGSFEFEMATSISSIPTKKMIKMTYNNQLKKINGFAIRIFDATHMVIVILMNCYQDFYPFMSLTLDLNYKVKISHILDVFFLLQNKNINWEEVARSAKEYELEYFIWKVIDLVKDLVMDLENPLDDYIDQHNRPALNKQLSFFSNKRYVYIKDYLLSDFFHGTEAFKNKVRREYKKDFYSSTNPSYNNPKMEYLFSNYDIESPCEIKFSFSYKGNGFINVNIKNEYPLTHYNINIFIVLNDDSYRLYEVIRAEILNEEALLYRDEILLKRYPIPNEKCFNL